MLSYQHGYHAGNHADVLKHLVLCRVLEYMTRKHKPLLYFDVHAGRGRYRLGDAISSRTGEYHQGIGRLWSLPVGSRAALSPYLESVQSFNTSGALACYPGSILLARHLLRADDRLVGCELHPREFEWLQRHFAGERNLRTLHEDGFRALIAALPPLERRGVVLFDPSYETESDDANVLQAVRGGLKRFATGVFMVWYPVVTPERSAKLARRLVALAREDASSGTALQVELHVGQQSAFRPGMTGSGMIVVNPPWPLAEQLQRVETVLPGLLEVSPGQGRLTLETHGSR